MSFSLFAPAKHKPLIPDRNRPILQKNLVFRDFYRAFEPHKTDHLFVDHFAPSVKKARVVASDRFRRKFTAELNGYLNEH